MTSGGGHRRNTSPDKPATSKHPPGWTTARDHLHTHEQEFSELYHELEVITVPLVADAHVSNVYVDTVHVGGLLRVGLRNVWTVILLSPLSE